VTDYLKRFGAKAVQNGYKIVPIRPRGNGEDEKRGKAPGTLVPYTLLSGWSDLDWSVKDVERSVLDGNGGCGIGVLTRNTPAADIDCHNEAVVDQIRQFIVKRLRSTIERVGMPPKTLLLFRTDAPFTKTTSKGYLDNENRPAKLEFLGAGQQFVALAQHPLTGLPYRWENDRSIADVPVNDLPLVTHADALAICTEFDRICTAAGWGVTGEAARGNFRHDDPFVSDAAKVTDLSPDELHQRLMASPNDDDYDTWVQTGMALFHQFEGMEPGLEWWIEWSEQSSKCDVGFCRQKWESGTFDIEGTGLVPVTFRYVLKRSEQAREEHIAASFDACVEAIIGAKTKDDLLMAAGLARVVDFNELDRRDLASKMQLAYKTLTQSTLPVAEAIKFVRYAPQKLPDKPDWLDGYVYVTADDGFLNLKTGRTVPSKVFDAVHSRLLLTPEERLQKKAAPMFKPSEVALNIHTIPIVDDRRYAPDEPVSLFTINGVPYVNVYAERGIPEIPAALTPTGRAAVERVQRHISHLIANERDAALFTSFLAHIVKTKSRVGWGVLLQGTQGDGKSFFSEMLGAVLGADNVNVIGGGDLEEKYTGWAENSLVVFVEEVRLGGEHRYKVIDRVKPLITNSTIAVRRMRRDIYKVANKASYILTSNYRDALPIGDEDTRYFPLFSRWQSREQLAEFTGANPTYYRDLYNSLVEAGSIRRWLLGYTLHPEFDARARAPVSSSRAELVEATTDPLLDGLVDAIRRAPRLDFCPMLVDSALVNDQLDDHGVAPLVGSKLHLYLQKAGYTSLGRVKVEDRPRRFWTASPERFRKTDDRGVDLTDTKAIRDWLNEDL
jgi:hypothetical protein